jgi:hypothetical protein
MATRALRSELAAMNVLLRVATETRYGQGCVCHILLTMARVAGSRRVFARKREIGLFAMIEAHARPSIGRVAGFTLSREASLVSIVTAMAARAPRLCVAIGRGCVAGLACNDRVKPSQWKLGEAVVKFDFVAPSCFGMTSRAPRTELRLVNILRAVAIKARSGKRLQDVASVAAIACRLAVGAFQRKFRVSCVIESRRLPPGLGMAGLAAWTEAAFMNILNCMAFVAGRAHTLVDFTDVARAARQTRVLVLQREAGLAMVERLRVAPSCHFVAVAALPAEITDVRFIGLVTLEAI